MRNAVSVARLAIVFGYFLSMQMSLAQQTGAEALAELSGPQVSVMGFGDITYVTRDEGSPGGFGIGQGVAHLAASLDDSFSVFAEISLTARDTQYSIEAERLIVKYDFSDLLKLSAGRYHTPIGYWNPAFHHGAWLQTTISRPEMVKFGSAIVPIHFVGALAEGVFTKSSLGLSYLAGFGNGRHANIRRAGDAGDINGDNAWMVQVNSQPAKYYGLNMGVGFYTDTATPAGEPEVNEKILSVHVAWVKESPEILFEYLHSEHELVTDSSVNGDVDAWYLQFAYRLKGKHRNWKPYARIESNKVDDTDPLLGGLGLNYEAGILGVRWDFNPYAALKGEYRNEVFDNAGRENNFRVQVSFVLAKL